MANNLGKRNSYLSNMKLILKRNFAELGVNVNT